MVLGIVMSLVLNVEVATGHQRLPGMHRQNSEDIPNHAYLEELKFFLWDERGVEYLICSERIDVVKNTSVSKTSRSLEEALNPSTLQKVDMVLFPMRMKA
ncbi:unnamed protein product [Amoebophrya sp. A25]|nr:unnamed protein product [Amoebophrya sp. A25]|eukprot:GSA25T00011999001.1